MTALRSIDAAPVKPSASIVYVTPEMAKRWLAKNYRNRPIKERRVQQYARDMATGRWRITGEAIKFDTDDALIDGQNRLNAVIVSGATIPMFVMRGIDPEAQKVMDSGAPRSARDGLGIDGYRDAKDLAPIARTVMAWEEGFYRSCMHQMNPTYTNSEIYEFVEAHPDLTEVTPWAKRVQRELRLPIGALGACAYRFMRIDADATADFYARICELHTAGRGDPIQTLLKRVADERTVRRQIRVPLGIYFQVRAWNAFREGVRLEKFQVGSEKSGWARIPEPK